MLLWKEWQHHLGVREKKGEGGGEGKGNAEKIGQAGFLSKYCRSRKKKEKLSPQYTLIPEMGLEAEAEVFL